MNYRNKAISFLGDLGGSPMAQDTAINRAAGLLGVKPRLLKAEINADAARRGQSDEAEIDLEKIGATSAYEAEKRQYWIEVRPGEEWSPRSREDFQLHIEITHGLSRKLPRGGGVAQTERVLNHVQCNRAFDVAIRLGGLPAGVYPLNGNKVLVPEKRMPMPGRPGDFPTIRNFLELFFGRGSDPLWAIQVVVFYASLKRAREKLFNRLAHRPRSLLGFIGPAGAGKNAVQERIITPLVGGVQADPGKYLTGRTEFNEGDWGADHLVLSDATLDSRPGMARRLRDNIKELVANPLAVFHPKGRTLRTLPHGWVITLSANDDDASAGIIPEIDKSTADKFSYLRSYAPPTPFPPLGSDAANAFWGAVQAELPCLAYHVDNYIVPQEHADPRWGVKAWRHPKIQELIDQLNPYADLGGFLDRWLAERAETEFTGTAEQLFGTLNAVDWVVWDRLCKDPTHLGQALARLSRTNGWQGRISSEIVREGPHRQPKTVWTLRKDLPEGEGHDPTA